MKKALIIISVVIVIIFCLIFALASCGGSINSNHTQPDTNEQVSSDVSANTSSEELTDNSEKQEVDKNTLSQEDADAESVSSKVEKGETTSKPVSTHEHSYTQKVVQPTCTKDGYTKYTCECGETYKDKIEEKLGHYYREWKVVKEATTSKKGLKESVCDRCEKATKTEAIPKKKTLKGIDPRIEIGVAKYTTDPQYELGKARIMDQRTWGEAPSITVDKDDSMHVTYYNKKGEKVQFIVKQPATPKTINYCTILNDGTYRSQSNGTYS